MVAGLTSFALFVASLPRASSAPNSPSFSQHIRPFLAKYCLECHNAEKRSGYLNVESYAKLEEGGKSGPAFVAGKPHESWLVKLSEGKEQPVMPPRSAKVRPKPEEVAVLRAWVAAGAVDDSAGAKAANLPDIKPSSPPKPSVTALAYHPTGKFLAAAGPREVVLIDTATNDVLGKLPGQAPKVTALAYSRDGNYLAVASGEPGKSGVVRLYFVPPSGLPNARPDAMIAAHKDLILDLAFSPDNQTLATCSYDRLIKLWQVDDPKTPREFKDHSDAVYGVAFSPDGKLLASVSADRAAKVWEVATGKRLYTLSEATDWLYAVAWSPDGKQLAAGGVDKSIRVWNVSSAGGEITHSVFAHEAAVLRLAYAVDGKTLYSLSEDRTAKAWDTAKMTERRVYPRQVDTVLAMSLRPPPTSPSKGGENTGQLALGGFDGVLVVFDEATGKTIAEPLPVKPKPPVLSKLLPSAIQRGQKVRLRFEGQHLQSVSAIVILQGQTPVTATSSFIPDGLKPNVVEAEVTIPATTQAGVCQVSLKSPGGQTAALPLMVDAFAATEEQGQNESPRTGQPVALPATIVGSLDRAGDVDFYRFEARAGQQVGAQIVLPNGAKWDPVLTLHDPGGQVVAESYDRVLGHHCTMAGTHSLGVRDREYRGDAGMTYRLHVGHLPVITSVFPLGLQRGSKAQVRVNGVFLSQTHVMIAAPADAAVGSRIPVSMDCTGGPALGNRSVTVGEFQETVAPLSVSHPITIVDSLPRTVNGELTTLLRSADSWHFTAKKGQPLILEVEARRLGSPLDSVIEIFDAKGPVPRATLRALAKTFVTFRDHDSAQGNIRIETWSELGINDWIWVNGELLRIKELPTHPDADCNFFTRGGQRVGYLDTTPTQLALGAPMYKVEIHWPGTTFPPNGYPTFTIPYRNDDGGPGYGKDSKLFFDPPADGEYFVHVRHAGQLPSTPGVTLPYRLTIRLPRPSFNVSFSPTSPAVSKGGALPITVNADRLDGFEGRIDLKLDNLPPGFSAPETHIPAGENSTAFALYAEPTATPSTAPWQGGEKVAPPLKLVARARIDGKDVVRDASGGVPKLVEPGDIVTATVESEITVEPGKETRLTVKIERRNGFAGRVPIEVKGLPHGVKVADIGLNGILITEKETVRTMRIYCYPWVEPMEHPIVVLAKREGKNTEHAGKSVLLKIVKPGTKAAASR
jgi:hypothetical protein